MVGCEEVAVKAKTPGARASICTYDVTQQRRIFYRRWHLSEANQSERSVLCWQSAKHLALQSGTSRQRTYPRRHLFDVLMKCYRWHAVTKCRHPWASPALPIYMSVHHPTFSVVRARHHRPACHCLQY